MTVTIGTYVKGVLTWDLPLAGIAQNVFYWQLQGLSPVADSLLRIGIGDHIEDMFANLSATWATDVALRDVVVNEWTPLPPNGWETGRYIGEESVTDTFSSGTDMLPHACAATITGFSDDPNVRTRKSLPGVLETQAVESTLQSATLSALAAWVVDWLAGALIDTNEYIVPGIPNQYGVWLPIASALISGIIGSQRRRKPGVGI